MLTTWKSTKTQNNFERDGEREGDREREGKRKRLIQRRKREIDSNRYIERSNSEDKRREINDEF